MYLAVFMGNYTRDIRDIGIGNNMRDIGNYVRGNIGKVPTLGLCAAPL
jgi:hypothetical protein